MAAVAQHPSSSSSSSSQHHPHYLSQYTYPSHHSIDSSHDHDHEDADEEEEEEEEDEESLQGDIMMDEQQQSFYEQQQAQAQYYHQHRQQYGATGSPGQPGPQQRGGGAGMGHPGEAEEDADMYSDDDSSTASIPDENIDFSLTYALHTFLATVEGQASVVKGDSLLLLDDANSYWWLVRVLKTEDVGYIPAENIETPYERLARLNKHRNVDLAAATVGEKQAGEVKGRDKFLGFIPGKGRDGRPERSGSEGDEAGGGGSRRVVFAPPTYVEHPGVTWSSDEEDEEDEEGEGEEGEEDEVEEGASTEEGEDGEGADGRHEQEVSRVERSLQGGDMEPDDGVEWADEAAKQQQENRQQHQQQQQQQSQVIQPKSNNPFAPRSTVPEVQHAPVETVSSQALGPSASNSSLGSSNGHLDPAQATGTVRRITATPTVAQGAQQGVLLPSAIAQQSGMRNASGQSVASVVSTISTGSTSTARSTTPTSPEQGGDSSKKQKKMRKGSKDDLGDAGGEKKKRGMLGGLFSRGKKDKKGVSNNDPRSSEDSIVSGAVESPGGGPGRVYSEEAQRGPAAVREMDGQQPRQGPVSAHSLKLQQQDQALQQANTRKYLARSPDVHSPTATDAVAQSAAAMRLAAAMGGNANLTGGSTQGDANSAQIVETTRKQRPGSVILSPNPATAGAGPASLLNVIRLFAGEHVKSDVTFKTVLLSETTTSHDLIRQAMQRFRMHSSAGENGYYLTVKDVNGEEMELQSDERPLIAFQEAVQRWSEDDDARRLEEITPTVKRSSISSISSVVSLSNHPAIQKLGMNDYSDDSAVKIYIHRRRPGSVQVGESGGGGRGIPEPSSEFSSYSSQLSTVRESATEAGSNEWSEAEGASTPPGRGPMSEGEGTATPPTPAAQPRFNPSLTVTTHGQSSPERYSSPSSRYTIQLLIHPEDLPDNSAFDPMSDAIIPRALLKDRQASTGNGSPRKRVFIVPRNATVVEAIEQGLERFGIGEGVVDGGDEVEDRVGSRRSSVRVRYALVAIANGQERHLSPSSKLIEAYSTPPNLRPMERTLPETRRRSRDLAVNAGSPADILPSDPMFVLRRVVTRSSSYDKLAAIDGVLQKQQQQQPQLNATVENGGPTFSGERGPLSPAEIIAAQRAASRANQKALISAHANATQGVDVVVPDRGTFRSSRLMEAGGGEVVRYSYIDGDGETYDISAILEEEWKHDQQQRQPERLAPSLSPGRPGVQRQRTDESAYVTAPSTPDEDGPREVLQDPTGDRAEGGRKDILRSVLQKAGEDGQLEEKLARVIHKVKSGSQGSFASRTVAAGEDASNGTGERSASRTGGRETPNGRSTPTGTSGGRPSLGTLPEGRPADATPRASHQQTAASVNRIISRHRQQPSIASILSDISVPPANNTQQHSHSRDDEYSYSYSNNSRSTTPVTATSSTHPTPQMSNTSGVFMRPVGSRSVTPSRAVRYEDDFGMSRLFALVQVRAWEAARQEQKARRKSVVRDDEGSRTGDEEGGLVDEVDKVWFGEKVEWEGVNPEVRGCLEGVVKRLEGWDREVDELLGMCAGR